VLPYHRGTVSRLIRPVILTPLVVVLVLIGIGAWWWANAGSSTPVSQGQAATDYGSSSAPAVAGAPRSGVWTYRASGDETVGLGPVSIDRDIPAEVQVVVRPAPKGFWRTLALSEEHVEASRVRVAPEGEYVEERITTLKVTGLGRDDRQKLVPPLLAYPADMEVGDSWTERYSMDKVRVVVRARVLSRTTLDVAGTAVPVLLVDKRGKVSGPVAGVRDDRVWWSPQLKMPVRWVLRTDLDGVAALRMDADLTLTSTAPAR